MRDTLCETRASVLSVNPGLQYIAHSSACVLGPPVDFGTGLGESAPLKGLAQSNIRASMSNVWIKLCLRLDKKRHFCRARLIPQSYMYDYDRQTEQHCLRSIAPPV